MENNNEITTIKLAYDLRNLLPNTKHNFNYNISNIKNINKITFSIKKDNHIINLSNVNVENNYVILYERACYDEISF